MICVVEATFSAISAVSRIEKLSISPAESDRRSRIRSFKEDLSASRSLSGLMLIKIVLTRVLPTRRRAAVLKGITTRSSWSPPIAADPFSVNRPMTRQLKLPTLSISPTGSPAPQSSLRTVLPITQTLDPARPSAGSKKRPWVNVRLSVVK